MPLKPDDVLTPIRGRENFKMAQFYFDSDKMAQYMGVVEFLQKIVTPRPNWVWDRPNAKAPWHWQTTYRVDGNAVALNVFPHKRSWFVQPLDGGPVVRGVGWDDLIKDLPLL